MTGYGLQEKRTPSWPAKWWIRIRARWMKFLYQGTVEQIKGFVWTSCLERSGLGWNGMRGMGEMGEMV